MIAATVETGGGAAPARPLTFAVVRGSSRAAAPP